MSKKVYCANCQHYNPRSDMGRDWVYECKAERVTVRNHAREKERYARANIKNRNNDCRDFQR